MKVKVTRLREHGRRVRHTGEGAPGTLGMHSMLRGTQTYRAATLTATDPRGSHAVNVIPVLFEPELVTIGNDALLLRGFEANDGAAHVQEWHCVFT